MTPRPGQIAPSWDWKHWAIIGGRASGKTTAAMAWTRGFLRQQEGRRALIIAPTLQAAYRASEIAGKELPIKLLASERQSVPVPGGIQITYGCLDLIRGSRYDLIVVDDDEKLVINYHGSLRRRLAAEGRLIVTGGSDLINPIRRLPQTAITSLYPGENLDMARFSGLMANLKR